MDKKILIAIDGSIYSSNSLDYLIRLFKNDQFLSVHLLSVVSSAGSDQSWMYDVDPLRQYPPAVDRRRSIAVKYLKDAQSRLIRNEFNEKKITFSVETTAASLSHAIHHEAVKGVYDGLLIGRRGMGKVGELFFGSISAYLIEQCHEVPLWIIDGEVNSPHFLLAVHCRPQSLMAADHLAYCMQDNPDSRIYLYHSSALFGEKSKARPEDFHDRWGKEWCNQHIDINNHLYHAHRQILRDNGVADDRIYDLPVQSDIEAGRDLLRKAKKNNCGTVVIGRRPKIANKGFFGGVSDRAMQQAQNIALWLVG